MVEWILGLSRLLQFGSLLSLFGAAVFPFYSTDAPNAGNVIPPAWPGPIRLLAVAAVVSVLGWIAAQTVEVTGSLSALTSVLAETTFGRALALRGALCVAVLFLATTLRHSRRASALLATFSGAAVVSFAWTGHGSFSADGGSLTHRVADIVHLLTAGVWIGALLMLDLMAVAARQGAGIERRQLVLALARFSAIGPAVVAALVLSGLINSFYLVWPHPWMQPAYSIWLLIKLALFGGMLALAAANRIWLTSRLRSSLEATSAGGDELRILCRCLLLETALAMLVLAAVAALGMTEPPVSDL